MTDETLTEMYSRAATSDEINAEVVALAVVKSETEEGPSGESPS